MVAQVAELVRRDLTADLSTAALSESVHVSAFHFHRIFAAVTGETPAAFVRRARLERAAKVMAAAPDRRLTDIAFDVGLSSPSELSRSFRRAHGMAPSDLEPGRRWAGEGAIPEPPDLSGLTEVVSLTARRLAVVRARGVIGLHDLSEPYRRLVDWCGEAGLGDAWQLIGACWDDHETTPLDRIHYEFGAVVDHDVPIEAPLVERRLPAATAVVVRCDGPPADAADAWEFLYRTWLPSRGRVPAHLPSLKLFRERPDQIGWERWHVDCAIALDPS